MFQLISAFEELDISELQSVYEESIQTSGAQQYPCESENMQILLAQQDFYREIMLGFTKYGCQYALWAVDGVYTSAARLERYADGYLLAGLETAPRARRMGYATLLIRSILENAPMVGISRLYSHVERRNLPSIAVHLKCGFLKVLDRATFLDGSVSSAYDTYLFEVKSRL